MEKDYYRGTKGEYYLDNLGCGRAEFDVKLRFYSKKIVLFRMRCSIFYLYFIAGGYKIYSCRQ